MLGILINRLIHFYILTNEVERDATIVSTIPPFRRPLVYHTVGI